MFVFQSEKVPDKAPSNSLRNHLEVIQIGQYTQGNVYFQPKHFHEAKKGDNDVFVGFAFEIHIVQSHEPNESNYEVLYDCKVIIVLQVFLKMCTISKEQSKTLESDSFSNLTFEE